MAAIGTILISGSGDGVIEEELSVQSKVLGIEFLYSYVVIDINGGAGLGS